MKRIAFALATAWALTAGTCLAEDTIPLLKTASGTFTNVTVLSVTDTHLFFRYAAGESSVKLKDLDPQLQKEFGYEPSKEAHFERQNQPVEASRQGEAKTSEASDVRAEVARRHMSSDEVTARDFRLEGGTKLRLTYPKFWVRTSDTALGEMPTIRLLHPFPDNFRVLVTILPKDNPFAKMDTYQATEMPAQYALRYSVETKLPVVTIEGPNAKGHYFAMTRKNPGKAMPAECEGMVKLGEKLIAFSVQCDDCRSIEADAVIQMMRTAEFVAADTAQKVP